MQHLLGSHSPVVKAAAALRTKKGRREQSAYAIEGTTLLAEALAAGLPPQSIFGTPAALEDARSLVSRAGCAVYEVAEPAIAKMSDLTSPPGLVAVLPLPVLSLEGSLDGSTALLLAGVADPGNAGTLLRTAEIFGVNSVIFTRDTVEPFNPKVVRSAMGANFRLKMAVESSDRIVLTAHAAGYRIVAAARDGASLPGYTFADRTLLAIGNERRGISPSLSGYDEVVTIPQTGAGDSLNAAVAGGILLYTLALSKNGALSRLGGHFGA